jgi:hypothetical protein
MRIFLSFSDLPILVQKNKISLVDLQSGLFFFLYDRKQVFSPLPPKEEIQRAYYLSSKNFNHKPYEKLQLTSPVAARFVVRGDEEDYCEREIILFAIQEILKQALIDGRLHLGDDNTSFRGYSFNSLRQFLLSNNLSLPLELENEAKYDYSLRQRDIYDLLKNHFDVVPLL